jgi:NAD(P)-dependent dehydrogenase (short-subunit alcohol dehydrogenase family)
MRLSGKVAVVTGGASGIGKATVRRLAIEGAAVVIGDLNPATGQALAADLRADGREASFVRVDVGDEESMAGLVDQAVARYGQLDVMFNNAGIGQTLVQDEASWWRLVRVNLTGVFLGCKHAMRVMQPRGRGSIVNTASHAGTLGSRGNIYGATKAGVISLTAHVAAAFAASGVRVNAMSPGNVETPFSDPRRDELMRRHWQGDAGAFASDPVLAGGERPDVEAHRRKLDAMHPTGRRAFPDDLARSVAFLASDESSFVNGHNLMTTGLIIPPRMIQRIPESRGQAQPPARLDGLGGKSVVVVTEHEVLAQALGARFEAAGARVVALPPARAETPAAAAAELERAGEGGPLAAVVFALRPDRGRGLLETTVDEWTDAMRANLRVPTVAVEAAIERVVPGGCVWLVSDVAAAHWGGPGSPAYCTAAGALTFHTEYWASHALVRGVRVNTLAAEDLSHVQAAPALGGPASADEIAALAVDLTVGAPGLTGLQLSLGATHPYPPP